MYVDWHSEETDDLTQIRLSALPVLVCVRQKSGGLYLYGRDHRFRPVVVVVPQKLEEAGFM
jgi:hypothetical protein